MINLTAKEIAEALGLSTSTVSRVINNKGRISEETRKKVFDYIEANTSGFEPKSPKSHSVGILVPNIKNEYYALLIENIEETLRDYGISTIVVHSSYQKEKEEACYKFLINQKVSAIIAITPHFNVITKEELHGVPFITIDGNGFDSQFQEIADVALYNDGYIGAKLATEELIKKGCKRILYLTNRLINVDRDIKYKGYKDTLLKYGMEIDPELCIASGTRSDNSMEDARIITEYLLATNFKFDGVFATSDRRALGVYIALMNNKIKVPEEIKIVGYDDTTIAESFKITTIHQDTQLIAAKVVKKILHRLNIETDHAPIPNVIPVYLVEGSTT